MITATRILECDAGHRVTLHESKCRNVHGHRYRFELTVTAEDLDAAGRVADFGVLKSLVGTWIDDHLDHGYVHRSGDPVADTLIDLGHKTYEMPSDWEPTAENLARLVGVVAGALLEDWSSEDAARLPLRVVRVRCWETPNCYADWTAEEGR